MRSRISSLPEDIIENILARLPVKSISRFRCVSKTWNLLFRNPNFIKNHLSRAIRMNKFNLLVTNDGDDIPDTEAYLYSIDNDVLSSTSSPFLGDARKVDYPFMPREFMPLIVGSSNGLVCIEPFSDNTCIWNPATREYKQVPEPSPDSSDFDFNFVVHGFGFDCKNEDYKLLKIVGIEESEETEARLYSLASNSWKKLGSIPYDFSASLTKGLLHNGVLHWFAYGSEVQSWVIVCFDISDETFHEIPLPINHSDEDEDAPSMPDLGIWDGKLCLLRRNEMEDDDISTHQNDHIDVWTMVDNKWSTHLKITAQITDMSYRRPIQVLQNGEILIDGGPRGDKGIGLISYDPNLERARALKIQGLPDVSEVETYIETLVPVNTGTYVGRNDK